jgi:uncharacterized membrane protein YeaQ/YmgE (transglycosylase-associated protein family)
MELFILVAAMIVVGLVVGWAAGLIWKGERPMATRSEYLVAVISAIAIGLLDWFIIPAMGFSDTIKLLGVIFEPALGSLLVLWVIRKAKS